MTIIESLQWRYATKKFDATVTLEETQIQHLKEAFNLTATSYGLQPIKMLVIQNKVLREELVAHSYGQRQVADASHLLVLCIHKNASTEDVENYFKLIREVRNTPDEVLAPFKENLLGMYDRTTQKDLQQAAKSQAYLALGNLLTVCASMQIDSCPMEGFIPEKYDEILNLGSKNLQSVLLLPVGKRAEDDYMSSLKKVRKPIEETVIDIY
ncbi:MAG: NAD(P)H-dependent oxidoreductase [Flavicella sp.]